MSDEDNPIDTQIDQPIEPKGVSEDQMRQEMAHVYDRVTASTAKTEADAIVPSILPGDSTQAAMEKTWDYLHASPQEQATQREASRPVEQVRDNAAKFGVTLDDKAAMEAAMKLEAEQANSTPSIPAELQPALKSIAELYPNRAPHEVANEYAQIDRDFKRDPVNIAFRILQERTGLSALEVARQVAMAHSPPTFNSFMPSARPRSSRVAFIAAYPDVEPGRGHCGARQDSQGRATWPRTWRRLTRRPGSDPRDRAARAHAGVWRLRWLKRTGG